MGQTLTYAAGIGRADVRMTMRVLRWAETVTSSRLVIYLSLGFL